MAGDLPHHIDLVVNLKYKKIYEKLYVHLRMPDLTTDCFYQCGCSSLCNMPSKAELSVSLFIHGLLLLICYVVLSPI